MNYPDQTSSPPGESELPARLVILKTGSTLPSLATRRGDFEDWILAGLGVPRDQAWVVDIQKGEPLPELNKATAVVVTGSHDMVTEGLDWSETAAGWLSEAVKRDIPILGICYGHQLLAHALGGEVQNNPNGREYGTVEVRLLPEAGSDPMFASLPAAFEAHAGHVQSVIALPSGAVRLAYSSREAVHAFRWGKCAWGIQFHPEFNEEIISAYLEATRPLLTREGQDPDRLMREVTATPHSASLLRRFAGVAAQKTNS